MHALNFDDPRGLKVHVSREDLWGIFNLPELEITGFRFKPRAFVVENSKLEGKIIEASTQVDSLKRFMANPKQPVTFISAGNPDDVKARYFAAFLAVLHKKHIEGQGKRANVLWETMYGSFENPAMRVTEDPTLLVIDNLSAIPNRVKYDKTRDLLLRWSHIPKVLVVAGEDPVSFAAARLFKPCHGLAYFPGKISKSVQTII